MKMPVPSRNQKVAACMAVAVFAVMALTYAFYPDIAGPSDDVPGEDGNGTLRIQVSFDDVLVSCNGIDVRSSHTTVTMEKDKDLTVVVVPLKKGTCVLMYTLYGPGEPVYKDISQRAWIGNDLTFHIPHDGASEMDLIIKIA